MLHAQWTGYLVRILNAIRRYRRAKQSPPDRGMSKTDAYAHGSVMRGLVSFPWRQMSDSAQSPACLTGWSTWGNGCVSRADRMANLGVTDVFEGGFSGRSPTGGPSESDGYAIDPCWRIRHTSRK